MPMPWETLFPKQLQLFNTAIKADSESVHPHCRASVLCEGPRYSTKTTGVIHRVIRHLYETPGALFNLVVKITKSATDGGVWNEIVGSDIGPGELDKWVDAGLTEIMTRNREGQPGVVTDSKTRTLYFQIKNVFGGISEMRLHNLEHDHQVKEKFKNLRCSGFWLSELSNFKDPNVYRASWMQLRMKHLKPWQHLWIGDTNPDEEGEDSWIYKFFIEQRKEMFDAFVQGSTVDDSTLAGIEEYRRSIRHIQFTLDDNVALSKEERAIIQANYMDDPGEEAREFHGLWVKGHGNKGKHFADLFNETIHVIGGRADEGDTIEIDKNTDHLFTGWDIGAVVNHAAGCIEKRMVMFQGQEISIWNIIDSVCHIGEKIDIKDLGIEMLQLMRNLEIQYKKKFDWTHYSDDSALTVWRPTGSTFDYQVIQSATNGEIDLTGVPKPDGSVEVRVGLMRKLLRHNRLFTSAKCIEVIDMFKNLHKGSSVKEYVAWDRHKHVFDWISYVLFMECLKELDTLVGRKPKAVSNASPIYVPLGGGFNPLK